MSDEDEVVRFLKRKLAQEEAVLRKLERPIEAQREKVRRLRASLAAQQTGTFGSRSVADADIITFLAGSNASASKPMLARQIAQGMSLDTRGLSRRLPRMVKHGLLQGTKDTGYWAPAPGRVA
jgi:hypothetical protein